MTRLILFLFFMSCQRMHHKDVLIKKIPVSSKEEAAKVIQNHVNFLKLIFEQSRDPYYNTPKWTDQCLKENVIGPIEGLKSVSDLFLVGGEPGYCAKSFNAKRYYLTYIYCKDSDEVREVKYPHELKEPELCR